jgi:hypothetical protein
MYPTTSLPHRTMYQLLILLIYSVFEVCLPLRGEQTTELSETQNKSKGKGGKVNFTLELAMKS